MFLKGHVRRKDGKTHRYYSLVESVRTARGPQHRVLAYLGELNISTETTWRKAISVFNGDGQEEQLELFPSDVPELPSGERVVQVRLDGVRWERPRDFGDLFLAHHVWRLLGLDKLLAAEMSGSDADVPWDVVAFILCAARLIAPSSELALGESFYPRTALDEMLYYAWKVATMGIVPGLVYGKSVIDAAKDSVSMLRQKPGQALAIRFGYSGICWIIGIATYIGAIYYCCAAKGHGLSEQSPHWLYNFYFMMGAPIFISVGIVTVLVRPFYLLMVTMLYTDTFHPKSIFADQNDETHMTGSIIAATIALVLLIFILGAVFFGDRLGLTGWIHHLAAEDMQKLPWKAH